MKVLILAGGYGSRLGNITDSIPKPMVEIGGKPIIWHIMKSYAHYGLTEFVLLTGYKSNVIKNYFVNYNYYNSHFTLDLKAHSAEFLTKVDEDWKVTILDTGLENLKGSRIKQSEPFIDDDINLITYGDGVCDIDIDKLLAFHKAHGKTVTMTGVKPPSRFGELNLDGDRVASFEEKPQVSSAGYINGGYMVFNRSMYEKLSLDPNCDFEFGPLEELAKLGEVMVYKHDGFWECVDTERDLSYLNKLWNTNKATWKKW